MATVSIGPPGTSGGQVSRQDDLESLYVSFRLAVRHLQDLMATADAELAGDLAVAKAHLLKAAETLADHVDAENISILRQPTP